MDCLELVVHHGGMGQRRYGLVVKKLFPLAEMFEKCFRRRGYIGRFSQGITRPPDPVLRLAEFSEGGVGPLGLQS